MSRQALFDALFVLQNLDMQEAEEVLDGLRISSVKPEHTTSKFDLSLTVEEQDDKLMFGFEYTCSPLALSDCRSQARDKHPEAMAETMMAKYFSSKTAMPRMQYRCLEQTVFPANIRSSASSVRLKCWRSSKAHRKFFSRSLLNIRCALVTDMKV